MGLKNCAQQAKFNLVLVNLPQHIKTGKTQSRQKTIQQYYQHKVLKC